MPQTNFDKSEILERITDAFVALDKNWCYTYMNKKAGEIFQRDPQQMIGKHIWTEFPEGIGQPFYNAYHKAMDEQKYIYLEEYYAPYDLWFENHIYPSPEGLTIYFRDITEKKKAEQAIKSGQQKLQSIFDTVTDTIFLIEVENENDFRFSTMNRAGLQAIGATMEMIANKNVRDIIPQPSLDLVLGKYKQAIETKNTVQWEEVTSYPTGVKTAIVTVSPVFDTNGKCVQLIGTVNDITERKKEEVILKQSENRFHTAFENAACGMCMTSLDGIFIQVNKALCKMLGYSEGELVGKTFRDFTHPDDISISNRNIEEVIKSESEILQFEKRYIRKNGDMIWATVSSSLLRDANKTPLYFITHIIDITERKLAEGKIKESELSYRSLIEQASDSIFIVGSNFYYIDINPSGCALTGYSKEEFLKLTFKDLIFEEDLQTNPITKADLESGKTLRYERRLKRKDGTAAETEATAKMMLDGRVIVFIRDITERKKAEQEIKAKGNFIESIINASPEIIYIYDIEERKNIYSNEGIKTNLGYSDEEIKEMGNQVLPLLMPPDDFQFYLNNTYPRYANATDKEIIQHEFRMRDKKGNLHWFYCKESIFLRKPDGTPKQIFGITMDVTEQKNAENKIAESETRLRTILQTEPECIKLLGANCELLEMNPAGLTMIEAENMEQVVGLSVLDLIDEKYRQPFQELTTNVFNGTPGSLEFEITGIKGTHRWLESHAVPLRDADGKIISLLGITRDITERKKAEEKIIESETRLRLLFENMLDAMAYHQILYKDGIPVDYKYIEVNEAFSIQTGLQNVEGKKVSEVIPGIHQSNPELMNRFARVASTGVPEQYETFVAATNQWFFTSLYSLTNNRVVSIFKNITEKKQSEQEILQMNEQLRNLSSHLQNIREEERTHIAREIHDELGQQLTGLKMDTAWLNKHFENDNKAKEKISDMLSLINDTIKSVRRISSELRPGILDDLGLIAALDWQSQEFQKRTSVKCRFTSAINEIAFEKNISNGIFRVYQEALTNITRHADATEVESEIEIKEKNILFRIKDNGRGFDAREEKDKGTLGLVGMRERALMLGGKIKIETEKGKGTVITLSVPTSIK